jgi:hypothetical protein
MEVQYFVENLIKTDGMLARVRGVSGKRRRRGGRGT